jgi:hypothetical protein
MLPIFARRAKIGNTKTQSTLLPQAKIQVEEATA